ncbi:MAG: hypothetical protein ACR2GH_00625 [Pseudonocardia sp.]
MARGRTPAVDPDGAAATLDAQLETATAVSLTGQLTGGELGRWCAANLTGTTRLADDVTAAAANLRPIRPSRVDDPQHWATVGGALGQRLAFATHHAPPYYALLGTHRAGLADWATLGRCATRFPTHTGLDPTRAGRANQLRPLPDGRWLDLDTEPGDRYTGRATAGTRTGLVVDLTERLVAYLATHTPPGRLADTHGAEAVLARVCVVLTDWETAYRTGQLPAHLVPLYANPDTTVPDLLAAVPTHQVAELVELTARAHQSGVLARLAHAAATPTTAAHPAPRGISGPVFVEHWADGDLLMPAAPGDGTVLLDVKTVTSARDPERVGRWLWQLLGYTWLDPGDHYRIRDVGLYLARHGTLITWPLDQFAAALLDDHNIDGAATAFRRLANQVITAETGQPARR